ncbi:Outer membrane cobalamin receptor protein, SusC/RagA family [Bacteroidales bacterium Barb6XT]|nr:Outer membrane cobalamin receptor protein, SusC/RagA family [Bacteroidales bacterium Barb6XT]
MAKLSAFIGSRKRLLFFILLLATSWSTSLPAWAQDPVTFQGKVIDGRTKEAIIGAGILLKNAKANTGTVTDFNGAFNLTVPSLPATIAVSYLGYKDQEIDIYEKLSEAIVISLAEDLLALDEVVVVGYGTQKRAELTGSIASVSTETLKQVPLSSIDNTLQGSTSGIQVSQVSGQPGGSVSIRIRGGSSIQGGNEPLYVVDGFPFYNNASSAGALSGNSINPLSSINPGDIESIDVLKDASATAIYGSRGANGVIIITTKKGKDESARVSYDFSIGTQSLRNKVDLLNAHDFAILRNNALYDAYPAKGEYQYLSQTEIDKLGKGTDWQDEAFRTAPVQNHQISITGGTNKTHYALSGNYFNQKGILSNTDFRRLSARINIDSQIYERLKVGINLTTSRTDANVAPNSLEIGDQESIISSFLIMPPTASIYDSDGSYTLQNPFENIFANPIASLKEQENRNTSYLVLGSAFGEYTIIKDLKFKVLLGVNINNNKEYNYIPSTIYEGLPSKGIASIGTSNPYSWLNENTLTYLKDFNRKHFFNFLVGFTQQEARTEFLKTGSTRFVNDYLTFNSLQSGSTTTQPFSDVDHSALQSYLARVNYNLDNKYFVSVSFRGDGSSRFGKERKWGYFPSVGGSWSVSNEQFFKPVKQTVDNLKLRFSYGKTGNQEIGSYQSLATLATVNYLFGNSPVTGFRPERLPNDDLGWETTYQTDFGIDVSFFKNRLSLTADAYYKKTNDLLLDVQIPWTTGHSSSLQNYGSVENKGIEFIVNSQNLTGQFKWNTAFNLSVNRNKVLEIGNSAESYIIGNYLVKIGEPLGTFYGCVTDGILQTGEEAGKGKFTGNATPKAGDRLYKDVSENGSFTTAEDRAIIGNAQADFIYGITNRFEYKGFALSFLFQGSVGNELINLNRQRTELFNGQQNAAASALDRWTSSNPSTTIPRAKLDPAPVFSDRFVEDASFIRLKTASLSYTLPDAVVKSIPLENVRLYVSGQNLLTWTKYSGYDPEVTSKDNTVAQGSDTGVYPIARTLTAGVSITF